MNRVSFLSRYPPDNVRIRSRPRLDAGSRWYEDERVTGDMDVLVIVLGSFDEARHESESLNDRFLKEEQSLGVSILPEFCLKKIESNELIGRKINWQREGETNHRRGTVYWSSGIPCEEEWISDPEEDRFSEWKVARGDPRVSVPSGYRTTEPSSANRISEREETGNVIFLTVYRFEKVTHKIGGYASRRSYPLDNQLVGMIGLE